MENICYTFVVVGSGGGDGVCMHMCVCVWFL